MRKKYLPLLLSVVLLLSAAPPAGLLYLIQHQNEFSFKAITFTQEGIEVVVPADKVALLYARKAEIGYSRAKLSPQEGGFWKAELIFNQPAPKEKENSQEKKPPSKKEEAKKPPITPKEAQIVAQLRKEEPSRKEKPKPAISSVPPSRSTSEKKPVPPSASAPAPKPASNPAPSSKPSPVKPTPSHDPVSAAVSQVSGTKGPSVSFPNVAVVKKVEKKEKSTVPQSFSGLEEKYLKALEKPISLTLKSVPISVFLEVISEKTGLTIVPLGDVDSAVVTVFVEKIPLWQAFQVVLAQAGMTFVVRPPSILVVGTVSAVEEYQKAWAASTLYKGDPMTIKVLRLKNIKASEANTLFNSIPGVRVRGMEKNNVVVVEGPEGLVARIVRAIKEADATRAFFAVQAKVIEVSENAIDRLGIQWGISGAVPPGAFSSVGGSTSPALPGEGGSPSQSISLPVASPSLGQSFSVGVPHNLMRFNATLSALIQKGEAKIYSSPYLTVQEGIPSDIKQVEEFPYTFTNNWAMNIAFREAGLVLKVNPYLVEDNLIKLEVMVEKSTVNEEKSINGYPPINRQVLRAIALLRDGEFRVLGGLKIKRRSKNRKGVPLLSKVPLLGGLFRSQDKQYATYELLIMLRAKVLPLSREMASAPGQENKGGVL